MAPTENTEIPAQDWSAVEAEVLAKLQPVVERQAKEVSERIYESLLTTTQDYLAENLRWNIASRLEAAERGRRAEWERATNANGRVYGLCTALKEAAKTFREYERLHAEKGTVEGTQKAAANAARAKRCEDALALAIGEVS